MPAYSLAKGVGRGAQSRLAVSGNKAMKMMQLRFVVAGALACGFLRIPLAAMDMARVEAGVDAAVARFGVNGQGVIVAVLDRGIDWKNDDFRNDDGETESICQNQKTDATAARLAEQLDPRANEFKLRRAWRLTA